MVPRISGQLQRPGEDCASYLQHSLNPLEVELYSIYQFSEITWPWWWVLTNSSVHVKYVLSWCQGKLRKPFAHSGQWSSSSASGLSIRINSWEVIVPNAAAMAWRLWVPPRRFAGLTETTGNSLCTVSRLTCICSLAWQSGFLKYCMICKKFHSQLR